MNPDRTVTISGQPFEVGTWHKDRFLLRFDEATAKVHYQAYGKRGKAERSCTAAAWVKWAAA